MLAFGSLRDVYDPWEIRSPRYRLGLFDDLFEPTRLHLNVNQPRRQNSTSPVDSSSFTTMLDVKHFKPDEIEVKTVDDYVVVHGKHEELLDEHGLVAREFTRRYKLPDDVEPDKVFASYTQDGILTIKAPRKQLEPPPTNERVVPITIQKPSAIEDAQEQQMQEQASAEESK